MWYFLCLSIGACIGYVICGVLTGGDRAGLVTTGDAAHQRAERLERANGVLRRELAELRLAHEAPRDHGYGLSNDR